ncbi:hypothetical protein AB7M70_011844 [Bradyrhizobium japonicum]
MNKDPNKIIQPFINKKTIEEMKKFFLNTSFPRILAEMEKEKAKDKGQ